MTDEELRWAASEQSGYLRTTKDGVAYVSGSDMSKKKLPAGGEATGDKVTWSKRAVHVIANQMMLGANTGRYAEGTTEKIRDEFRERYRPLIEKIVPELPRGMSAVGAAIAKCAIRYGDELAIQFAHNVKEMLFQGKNDPCHRYYMWLHGLQRGAGREKKDKVTVYCMTVAACRAFCEGRSLTRVCPATKDIFQWDDDWQPIIPKGDHRKPTEVE